MKYTFGQVAQELIDLQNKKNTDYGGAYFENLDDEGLAAARLAIGNKWRRFKHLSMPGSEAQVKESLEDTLIDMAGYALMTVIWLREQSEEKNEIRNI